MHIRAFRSLCVTAAVLIALTSVTGCSKSPKDLIVGKWQSAESKEATLEFTSDGKCSVSAGKMKFSGTYKFLDAANVEVDFSLLGTPQSQKMAVSFPDKDTLTAVDDKGKTQTMHRVS